MTPEQESQRATDSPAPAKPRGRWVARAALADSAQRDGLGHGGHGAHACAGRVGLRRGQPLLPLHL